MFGFNNGGGDLGQAFGLVLGQFAAKQQLNGVQGQSGNTFDVFFETPQSRRFP
jgi:hypothetical protein